MITDILLTAVIILTIAFIAVVFGLYMKNTNRICKSKKRLDGKTTLVTGGTTGIGFEIAMDFADRGARVIIASPYAEEGALAEEAIVRKTGNNKVIFKQIDLASLYSVRNFADDILNNEERLDILMNNAGIGYAGNDLTEDGLHITMQVNYFGHFLLTLLLLPLLRKSGRPGEPSRIVNTSSCLHRIGKVDFENMNRTGGGYWSTVKVYGNSKICLILFSKELTKRLKMIGANVVINSVDPGAAGTRIFNQLGWLIGGIITFFWKYFSKTPWEGAQTGIYAAVDSKAGAISGEFFRNCRLCPAKKTAYDDETAGKLWDESVRLVKFSKYELQSCFKNEPAVSATTKT